jgi:signal transduction histidine kinase
MQVTAAGRRDRRDRGPSVPDMTKLPVTTWAAAAITLVGVPTGLVLMGGNVQGALTLPIALLLALLSAASLRWPVPALLVSAAVVVAWRGGDLITEGWAWPVTVAFAVTMAAGKVRWAVGTGVVLLLYGLQWDSFVALHGFENAVVRIGAEALWLTAVLAGVQAWRNGLRWQDEATERIAQTLQRQEVEARRRRAEERVDIARDLHDVVSHTLAVVGVHLNVALDAFDAEPDEARAALRLAQDVRGRAMVDLKALVGVLREGEVAEPAAGLAELDRTAERMRAAGLEVTLTEFGERDDVPAPVATAIHRVVQESLTNTVRHAAATRAIVTLRYSPQSVVVDVQDNGRGAGTVVDGHGIAGMRERVAALGGALTAGPGRTGFTVRATIPVA